MTKEQIEKYIKLIEKYNRTEESEAISCIRVHGGSVADEKWIEIIELTRGKGMRKYQFGEVIFATYKKTIKPQYPKRSEFQDEDVYRKVCRAVTYETATIDIKCQKTKGIAGRKYVLNGKKSKGEKGYSAEVIKYHSGKPFLREIL